jgi:hypothetical protein
MDNVEVISSNLELSIKWSGHLDLIYTKEKFFSTYYRRLKITRAFPVVKHPNFQARNKIPVRSYYSSQPHLTEF